MNSAILQDRIMLVSLLPGVIYQKNVTSIITAHPTLYKILHTLLQLSRTPVQHLTCNAWTNEISGFHGGEN